MLKIMKNIFLFNKLRDSKVKEFIVTQSEDYRKNYTDLCNKLNCITEDELNKLLKNNPFYLRIIKDMDLWKFL